MGGAEGATGQGQGGGDQSGSSADLPGGGAGQQGDGEQGGMAGGGQQGTGSAGGTGVDGIGSTDELDELFEKSLGDFDGVLGQEREGMASTGQGSGRGAGQREAGDAEAVAGAASRGGGIAGGSAGSGANMPGGGSMGGGMDGSGSAGSSGEQSSSNSEAGGGGQKDKPGEFEGGDIDENDRQVAKLPEDIPTDGSADDQVAKQIREAAMAEQDPIIREALWDEYRKHMGIKKK
ncbi:MAG: hypothetical protein ACN4GT_13595 [Gammaproteobacteria bacterium]